MKFKIIMRIHVDKQLTRVTSFLSNKPVRLGSIFSLMQIDADRVQRLEIAKTKYLHFINPDVIVQTLGKPDVRQTRPSQRCYHLNLYL